MYLDVTAACDLAKVFLALQSFVHFVIRHTEHTKLSAGLITTFCENNKVSHERHYHSFCVQAGGNLYHFVWCDTVN